MEEIISRRPLSSRDHTWAKRSAIWLKNKGIQPNSISIASTAFASIAALALYATSWNAALTDPMLRIFLLMGVVVGILVRLICNLLDGMVAVEGGLKTASGEVFNDLPDRISDLLLFVALGYAAAWTQAGWMAASLAILTAYIRYLGAGCGVGHFFSGPMAKQHRMGTVIGATLASALLEPWIVSAGTCYRGALVIVIAGSFLTCLNRTMKIVKKLENHV